MKPALDSFYAQAMRLFEKSKFRETEDMITQNLSGVLDPEKISASLEAAEEGAQDALAIWNDIFCLLAQALANQSKYERALDFLREQKKFNREYVLEKTKL